MLNGKRIYRLIAILISLLALAIITVTAKSVVGLNATTVALLYLLVVLAVSAFADLACGLVIAVASGLLVNYFFLPPFGTFYIEAPEDWVSFFAYTVTAVVFSHFAVTVRRRAVEADRLKEQLSKLSQFADALITVPEKNMSLAILIDELRRAYDLSYCAIYLFGKDGIPNPIFSGTRPSSQSAQSGGVPSNQPNTLLDVLAEEGPDVQCLTLKDQGETVGALVISQASLLNEVAEAIASIISSVIRQNRLP